VDRCALFVDAGYVLADGAMAVHGTRNRESVAWDYAGVLQFLSNVARDRTGLPLLRCYWYEATVESRRTPEHDALADLPGVKLRLGRMRPGRREGVESEIHRDLTTLARNTAISDALVVSAEEDLAQVIAEVQDLGLRVTILHITVDGNWTISRTLRQECDDIVEIGEAHLRPYVDLVVGAEPAREDERQAIGSHAGRAAANGHAPIGSFSQPALSAGSHAGPPAIYTAPVVAEYQRAAQPAPAQLLPQSNGQSAAAAGGGSGPGQAAPALPRRGHAAADQPGQPRVAMSGGQASGPGQPAQGSQSMAQPPSQQSPQPGQQPSPPPPPASLPQHMQLPAGMGGQQPGQSLPAVAQGQPGMPPGPAGPQPSTSGTGSPLHGGFGGQSNGLGSQSNGLAGQPSGLGMPQAPAQQGPSHRASAQQGAAQQPPPQQALPHAGVGAHHGAAPQPPGAESAGPQPVAGQAAASQPPGAHPAGQQPGVNSAQPVFPPGSAGGGFRGPGTAAAPGPGPAAPGQQAAAGHAAAHAAQLQAAPVTAGPAQPGFQQPGQAPAPMQPAAVASGQVLTGPAAPQPGSQAPAGQEMRAPARPYQAGPGGQPGGYGQPGQRPGQQFPGAPPPGQMEGAPAGQQAYVSQQGAHGGPPAQHSAVPPPVAVSLADAVQAAHGEGFSFGQTVARDAPALWLEAVLARKPRMPSDLEARLLQDSALPIDSLLHDEVRHALRRGFWDALERSRH
jgi:hypothetical protein